MKKSLLPLTVLAVSQLPWARQALAQGTPPAPAAAPTNLALNKKYISLDSNRSGWEGGLTDGSWQAQKGTTYATGSANSFPKTVTVDLEAPTAIGYIALGVPPFGSTKTVKISLSTDGTTFTEAGQHEFAQKKEEKFLLAIPATTARYVCLTYADNYAEQVQYPVKHAFTTEVAVYAPGAAPVLPPTLPPEKADAPAPKRGKDGQVDARFLQMHESFLARAKEGPIGVLFIGDSITNGWRGGGKDVWPKYFGDYSPANFGIGGDRTQHVLWRFENGELDGIAPKVVVLMIGTNNSGSPAEEITRGVQKVASEIHRRLPKTKLLLLGIFPRSAKPTDPARAKIAAVNAELAKLDDGDKTRYLDIGAKFLDADGNLPKEIMPDALHPNAAGYQIWADAMKPLLDEMMK